MTIQTSQKVIDETAKVEVNFGVWVAKLIAAQRNGSSIWGIQAWVYI